MRLVRSFTLAQRLTVLLVGVVLASLVIVAIGVDMKRREYASEYRDVRARSAAALVYSARRLLVAVPPAQRRDIARALTASGTLQLLPDSDGRPPSLQLRANASMADDIEPLREAIARYATQPAEVFYGDEPSPRFWVRQFIDGEPWWVIVLVSESPHIANSAPWAAWLLVLLLVIVVGGIYAASLARPLERLSQAAALTGGAWPEPIDPQGPRELQQLTQAFNSMVMRLKEIERERSVLLGGIPHDLRAPLTRLRMRIAMLTDTEDVRGLEGDVVAMERIVRQFADYLAERRDQEGGRAPLGVIANEAIAAYRQLGHEVTLELRANPAREVPELVMRRVLDNLIGNALEHGRPPVEVSIETQDDGRLVVQVADHGAGIPEAREADARRPFVKLDHARGTAGCGLGLAIVQQLVAAHGGELRFLRGRGRFTAVATLAPR